MNHINFTIPLRYAAHQVYRPMGNAFGVIHLLHYRLVALAITSTFLFGVMQVDAGSLTATVSMGLLSPNPVKVILGGPYNSTTSSPSASYSNLNPAPSSEADLSETYGWSVTNVQYSSTSSGTYGAPPSNSYSASFSHSSSSSPTLNFTPKIGGYWKVSAHCSITVTDKNTGDTWSGSGSDGPSTLTSYYLHIKYGGTTVDNKTEHVCVGEQTPVSATYSPSDMTLQWSVPGTIIANYAPKPGDNWNQSATITKVTSTALTQSNLTYYWMDTDSGATANEQVTLNGTLPSPSISVSVNTTFNVYRPTPTFYTSYVGGITLDDPAVYDGLAPSGSGSDPGIEFHANVPSSTFGNISNLETVQLIGRATATTEQYDSTSGSYVTFDYTLPSAALPGPILDTSFPYGWDPTLGPGSTDDSPDYSVDPPPTGSGFGTGAWSTVNVQISESFTHYLLFVPTVPSGINATYAPLSHVNWGWTAEAVNHWYGFSLASSAKVPSSSPIGSNWSTLPTWNNNAQPAWSNPAWFIVP